MQSARNYTTLVLRCWSFLSFVVIVVQSFFLFHRSRIIQLISSTVHLRTHGQVLHCVYGIPIDFLHRPTTQYVLVVCPVLLLPLLSSPFSCFIVHGTFSSFRLVHAEVRLHLHSHLFSSFLLISVVACPAATAGFRASFSYLWWLARPLLRLACRPGNLRSRAGPTSTTTEWAIGATSARATAQQT